MKKALSIAMSMAMVMTMSLPAFAADGEAAKAGIEISGNATAAEIDVILPTNTDLVINPYGLEFNLDDEGEEKGTDTIYNAVGYFVNAGLTDISVSVTVTGTPSTGVTLAAAPFDGDFTYTGLTAKAATTKSIFASVEISDAATVEGDSWDADAAAEVDLTWADTAYDKAKDILVAAKATTLANAIKLDAMVKGDGGNTYSFAGVKIVGQANGKATTAWTEDDSVAVQLAFDVLPTVLDDAT